jgi:mannose-1-phosphate guanylyltransferase
MGTRLRPLTIDRPKVLLPVCNREIIARQVDAISGLVDEILVAAGFRGGAIEEWARTGRTGPPKISVILEEEPLGTGGALYNLRDKLEDTFIAMNGDIVTDMDFSLLLEQSGNRSTIATIDVEDASRFGSIIVEDGKVMQFREKESIAGPGTANSALYILNSTDLDLLPPGRSSLERDLFPCLARKKKLMAYRLPVETYWSDIGTPTSYLEANLFYGRREKKARIGRGTEIRGEVDGSSVVGPRCVIPEGCSVRSSLLLSDVVLSENASVRGSILGPGSRIGRGASVESVVLGDQSVFPPE